MRARDRREIIYLDVLTPLERLGRNIVVSHVLAHLLILLVVLQSLLSGIAIALWFSLVASEIALFALWNRIGKQRLDRAMPLARTDVAIWCVVAFVCHLVCFPVSMVTSYVAGVFVGSMLAGHMGLRIASPDDLQRHDLPGVRLSLGQLFLLVSTIAVALGAIRGVFALSRIHIPHDEGRMFVFLASMAMASLAASLLSLTIVAIAGTGWLANASMFISAVVATTGLSLIDADASPEARPMALICGAALVQIMGMWPFLASGWRVTFAVPLVESAHGIVYVGKPAPSRAFKPDHRSAETPVVEPTSPDEVQFRDDRNAYRP
jgi:hypothetical protein